LHLKSGPAQQKLFLPVCIVAFVAFLSFANSLNNEFVIDDRYNIVENEAIADIGSALATFDEAWGASASGEMDVAINTNYWRPFALLTYSIDRTIWDLNPTGFHLTNVLLHSLCCVLVFLLGMRLFPTQRWGVFAAALIFAVHPVHTEVVDVITYRTDLLAGLFYVGALLAWVHPRGPDDKRSWVVIAIACLCFSAGCASKEMAVSVPVALALHDLLLVRSNPRRRVLELAPLVLLAVGYMAIRAALLEPSPLSYFGDASGSATALTMIGVFGRYLGVLVSPGRLNFFYDWSVLPIETEVGSTVVLVGIACLVGYFGVSIWLVRRKPQLAFCLLLMPVILFPVSQVVPTIIAMGERFLYVACAGPFLAFCVAIFSFFETRQKRWIPAVVSGVIVVLFALLTIARNADWHDDRSILEASTRDWPESFNHWLELARLEEREGNLEVALGLYDQLGVESAVRRVTIAIEHERNSPEVPD